MWKEHNDVRHVLQLVVSLYRREEKDFGLENRALKKFRRSTRGRDTQGVGQRPCALSPAPHALGWRQENIQWQQPVITPKTVSYECIFQWRFFVPSSTPEASKPPYMQGA